MTFATVARAGAVLRPLGRTLTYTRWLHLLLASVVGVVTGFVQPGMFRHPGTQWLWMAVLPVPLLLAAAAVPGMRAVEGVQARLLVLPHPHARYGAGARPSPVTTAPSANWADRLRTAGWLLFRLETGVLVSALTVHLPLLALALGRNATAHTGPVRTAFGPLGAPHRWYALLAPWPLVVLMAVVVGAGAGTAAVARRLLGPSAADRLAALEERTARLLEHNRLAQELHDSIGHALTVMVVQAGAAQAGGGAGFRDRALATIEDTGREALTDLERALRLLREGVPPAGGPGLGDVGRLLASAESAGAAVRAEVTGPVGELPDAVSREGYRMVQESLTNVLRHAGPVPVSVRVAADRTGVELEVRNALPDRPPGRGPGGGRGLRGMRERAALLDGTFEAGPRDGHWRVAARLPALG
ncbi:sensor histidine kinase [Streptomyces celluloflavus]|uniref:histidine kinase n=1 Tax=Streptomyces celluloflavus TaxID=58344 RepID=A0ABW7RPP4_9ACTN|nr:histidine kinase [Streptomyces celluloflavus]